MTPITTDAIDVSAEHPSRSSTIAPLIAGGAMLAVVAIDQITKNLALQRLSHGSASGPGPFWFRLVANRGALMGLPMPRWLLIGVVVAVVVMAVRSLTGPASIRVTLAWGLVVGGATGNLVDRFQHRPRFPAHAVVDFVATSALPTFNLADVAVVVGLIGLVTSDPMNSAPPSPAANQAGE